MPLYRDVGVVVRTHKLGETDRIVTVVTQDSGRIRAVAKGVRKPGSRFGSRLEPLSHVQLQLYRGRELDVVNQVELVEVSSGIRSSLEATTDAMTMCEMVDQLSHDRAPAPHLYRMLVGALRQLNVAYGPLVLPALQLRLLEVEGVGPRVDGCVRCGTAESLVAFDVVEGGVQCVDHRRGVSMSGSAIAVLQRILGGDVAGTLRRTDYQESTIREVVVVARTLIERHLERRLRASSLFEAPPLV